MTDDYHFGKLAQAVKTLSDEVALLRGEVGEIKGQMNRGKGIVLGMLLAAGGLGAGFSHLLDKMFGK